MTTPQKFGATALLLVAIGVGGYEAQQLTAQHALIATLQTETAQLTRQVTHSREQGAALESDLAHARRELAEQNASAEAAAADPAALQRRTWLARTKKLKGLFAERPDQAIPELRLLGDREWLAVARNASFDTEEDTRKALATARSRAKSRFVAQLDAALRGFTRSTDGQLPADIFQLIPFFELPPDSAMLQRYTMTRSGRVADDPTGAAIEERGRIDPEHDRFFHVQASGGWGSGSGPSAEFSSGISRALRAYRQAHSGEQPEKPADLFPHFNPPLTSAQQQRFLEMTAGAATGGKPR